MLVDSDGTAIEAGLSTKHGNSPRKQNKNSRKRKRQKNDGRPPDTNSKLFPSKKKSARQKPTQNVQGTAQNDPRFCGPKWKFTTPMGAVITNTCPLDSLLIVLFGPLKGKAMLSPFPELLDPDSLLVKAFHHMENHNWDAARMQWLTDWHKHDLSRPKNMFSNIHEQFCSTGVIGPLDQSFRIKFERTTICMSDHGLCDVCPRKQCVSKLSLVMFAGQTLVHCFENNFGEKTGRHCHISHGCKGPTFCKETDKIEWPHVLCIDTTSVNLEQHQLVTKWGGKKFILRGTVLCARKHFTTLVRMPNGWMHYDGCHRPMITFHNLQDTRGACRGREPALTLFEVVDEAEDRDFLDASTDWRDIFVGRAASGGFAGIRNFPAIDGSDSEGTSSLASPKNLLKKLNTQVSQKTKTTPTKTKKTQTTTARKKVRRQSRAMLGWSLPVNSPTRGPLPKCRGCKKPIERHEKRVRHTFKQDPNEKPLTWQWHLKTGCLCGMGPLHMKTFLDKRFASKLAQRVQASVMKFRLDDSDDESSDEGS